MGLPCIKLHPSLTSSLDNDLGFSISRTRLQHIHHFIMRISLHIKTIYLNQQIPFLEILTSASIHDLLNPLPLVTIGNREAEAIGTFDDNNI